MSIPIIWHQDASKTWMAIEDNSEHVEGFAFVPIVSGPNIYDRWNMWFEI
jgi:hypothetical protein